MRVNSTKLTLQRYLKTLERTRGLIAGGVPMNADGRIFRPERGKTIPTREQVLAFYDQRIAWAKEKLK
jgi:hypothetical protein